MSRNIIPFEPRPDPEVSRLNIGCGRHYHCAWTNLDLQSDDPSVLQHDICSGIPFEPDCFNAVYHSHVLEHLAPSEGKKLIAECFRVLKPGGVLRIVVPDLEEIAQLYLAMHEEAWQGNERGAVNYYWMKMELLDQMVRNRSGGLMGPYMANIEEDKAQFVQSRLGSEFLFCRTSDNTESQDKVRMSMRQKWSGWWKAAKETAAKRIIKMAMGTQALEAFEASIFRNEGEIHRWMYDRFSLRELCRDVGFHEFQVTTAFESEIEGFCDFELDSVNSKIRKPDSLFVECRKPRLAAKAAA